MKKIFYITLFALCAFLMVACDGDKNYPFSIVVDNVSELRESVVLDLTLVDPDKALEKSEIKSEITKKGSKSIITTKSVKFESDNKKEVTFSNLTADTEYSIIIYAGYEGDKVTLVERNVKTSDEGTKENPYKIDSYDDFTNIVKKDSDGYFKIADEVEFIDFNGKSISPLFTTSNAFEGHFDGNNKTIKNFKLADKAEDGSDKHVSTSSQYHGLFGYIGDNGKIFDVTLDSFTIYAVRSTSLSNSKASNYGVLAGYCSGTVENVNVTNSTLNIKTTNKNKDIFVVGGLVGNLAKTGTLNNVNVDVDINVEGVYDAVVGGVCGTTVNAQNITKVENDVTVNVANIYKATYTGNINVNLEGTSSSSATVIGGILGKNYSALVDDCTSSGVITLTSKFTSATKQTINVGGLVGWMISDKAVLSNSKSTVSFSVTSYDVPKDKDNKLTINAGLLVGKNGGVAPARSIISNCTYELASGASNSINVSYSDSVIVSTDLVALEVSESNDSKSLSKVEILVKEYKVVADGETPTVESEYTKTVNAAE